jgi:release factor glutamine methyltransferase
VTLDELRSELRARTADESTVRIVLEEITGESYAEIARHPMRAVSSVELAHARTIATDLDAGVPLQHAIGHWTFRNIELVVDERALIPRPETELLVDIVLRELARLRESGRTPLRCRDLGTRTGAIALSLVWECVDVDVTATDVSADALALAKKNADRLLAASERRLLLRLGSWYDALDATDSSDERFDVICSNPPYLSRSEWQAVDPIVRDHDPEGALVAGSDGLDAVRVIAAGADRHLSPDGALVVEIGWLQGAAAAAIARGAGARFVEVLRDFAGRDRFILARF